MQEDAARSRTNKLLVTHFLVEKEGETTSDRQKWKEGLERYSRNKYQDEEMRTKARNKLGSVR